MVAAIDPAADVSYSLVFIHLFLCKRIDANDYRIDVFLDANGCRWKIFHQPNVPSAHYVIFFCRGPFVTLLDSIFGAGALMGFQRKDVVSG